MITFDNIDSIITPPFTSQEKLSNLCPFQHQRKIQKEVLQKNCVKLEVNKNMYREFTLIDVYYMRDC